MLSRIEFIHNPNITVDTSKFEAMMHEMYSSELDVPIDYLTLHKYQRYDKELQVKREDLTTAHNYKLENLENTAYGQKRQALMIKKEFGYQKQFEYNYSNGITKIFIVQELDDWRRVFGKTLLVPNCLKCAKTSHLNAIYAVKGNLPTW